MTKLCHSDPKFVMKIGNVSIYAGSKEAVLEQTGWAFAISALGQVPQTNPLSVNDAAKGMLPPGLLEWAPMPLLGIDWPDGSVPKLNREWWIDLVEWLKTLPEGDVAVFCFGGHGRTGTALAILAYLSGQTSKKKDPVSWVRAHYCPQAVETGAQIEYLERVLNRKITAQPSYSYRTASPYVSTQQGGGAQHGLPFGQTSINGGTSLGGKSGGSSAIATAVLRAQAEAAGEAVEVEVEGKEETLLRFEDEYGLYWTDLHGNIVAVSPDDDDLEALEAQQQRLLLSADAEIGTP